MVDRISTLSDDILCHILSFLPTKDVVSTSVLSKRWRPLWLSLPCLHFDLNPPNSRSIHNNNCDFITRILLSRDDIKSLRFQCGSFFYIDLDQMDYNVNDWVDIAIQRGLNNLHLSHPCDPHVPSLWSSSLFSCKTLVVLKLVEYIVDVDDVVHLPTLKTLHLECAYFQEPRCVLKLLSGCPILENLETHYIQFDEPIEEDLEEEQDEPIEEDLEKEHDEPIEEDMEKANGDIIHYDYDGVSLPKLVNAEVSGLTPDIPLKAISSVRFMRMAEYLGDIPVFPNLTHLELKMYVRINWPMVLEMIKQCPKLQVLVLNLGVVEFSNVRQAFPDMDLPYPQFVPECLSSQLTKCSIRSYKHRKSLLLFVKYIMKNSRSLRAMTIYNASSYAKLEMLKELEGSSATCQISFMD